MGHPRLDLGEAQLWRRGELFGYLATVGAEGCGVAPALHDEAGAKHEGAIGGPTQRVEAWPTATRGHCGQEVQPATVRRAGGHIEARL